MARDDWKYYDDDMDDEGGEGEAKAPSPERQCVNCLHWMPREASSCSWCGKPFDDGGGSS